jgi:spermidine synthase
MSFGWVLILAIATGFLSLSQEILWANVLINADQGRPDAFAHMLGAFLVGIALGALIGRRIQQVLKWHALTFIGAMLIVSAFVFFWAFPLGAWVLTLSKGWGLLVLHLLVFLTTFSIGGVFPTLCDYGISSVRGVGRSVSWIYLANIVGATAGPLVMGFWLLDVDTVVNNILMVSVIMLILGEVILLFAPLSGHQKMMGIGGVGGVIVVLMLLHPFAYGDFWERVHFNTEYQDFTPETYRFIEESRSGVVGVWSPNSLYGGGVYDGRFNLDPVSDSNLITRAYFVPGLHPNPRRIYMVGMGSGSWARVLADYPEVEKIVVVEINPAYLTTMRHFPEIGSVLGDPRIDVYVDDGRRWLNQHPDEKFDAMVMNVTWHWRGHATHVLSEEFLKICKRHLNPGGFVYYNATGSEDVLYTAAQVFEYVTQYINFVAASDRPFDMTDDQQRSNLMKFSRLNGQVLEDLLAVNTANMGPSLRRQEDLWRITDDNMATEFKTNGSGAWWRVLWPHIYQPDRAWSQLF